ncbi:MAG: AAA family ATPase [Chloroflexi bacterium]|nr:AAA family ATPase [Chloroflexota bacterium]
MYLETIQIQGFKSLANVELRDLAAINVFHGLNDVGKSNVLQALDLFFQLLPIGARALTGEEESSTGLSMGFLQPYSYSVFRQGGNGRIVWEAQVCATRDSAAFPVRLVLERTSPKEDLQVTLFWEVPPAITREGDISQRWFAELCEDPANDFTLVNAERRFAKEWLGEETAPIDYAPHYRHGSPVGAEQLKQVLFEAVPHRDLRQRERFKRLAKILDEQFGVGELDVTWDAPRELERRFGEPSRYVRDIIVRFLRPDMPEPLNLADVGSGVQQLILMLGQMLFNPAQTVGIEEPEMNLSPDWQIKLLNVFKALVAPKTGVLEQLFITSHSLAFRPESADYYDVTYDPQAQATLVTRRPLEERRKYFDVLGLTPAEGEELGPYLNPQNQITVPQRVIDDLGLKTYEPVFFIKGDPHWRLCTKEELLARMQTEEQTYADQEDRV